MPEFEPHPPLMRRGLRMLRRPGLGGMSILVALVFLLSGPDTRRLGDGFQYALPILALGCAAADGRTVHYLGRFLLLEVFIHAPKTLLGDTQINRRPNGGDGGFPSGHTAAAAFGATALVQGCLRDNPAAQAVAILAAGFTGGSRIATKNHTIWQVLAGAILGFLMNYLSLSAFDALFARSLRRAGRALGLGTAAALALALLPAPRAEAAEWTIDVYTGSQSAPHSHVSGTDPAEGGTGDFDFTAGWEGKSFSTPPYYGVRVIRWRDESFGIFADINHTKAYADDETKEATGFQTLEFSDGLNNLNIGPIWRWPTAWGWATPYAGVGLGVVIPHVEVKTTADAPKTFKYEYGGPSISLIAGAEKQLGKGRYSAFLEYKFTYSKLDVDLDGGGDLSTKLVTNALNLGLRVKLGRI